MISNHYQSLGSYDYSQDSREGVSFAPGPPPSPPPDPDPLVQYGDVYHHRCEHEENEVLDDPQALYFTPYAQSFKKYPNFEPHAFWEYRYNVRADVNHVTLEYKIPAGTSRDFFHFNAVFFFTEGAVYSNTDGFIIEVEGVSDVTPRKTIVAVGEDRWLRTVFTFPKPGMYLNDAYIRIMVKDDDNGGNTKANREQRLPDFFSVRTDLDTSVYSCCACCSQLATQQPISTTVGLLPSDSARRRYRMSAPSCLLTVVDPTWNERTGSHTDVPHDPTTDVLGHQMAIFVNLNATASDKRFIYVPMARTRDNFSTVLDKVSFQITIPQVKYTAGCYFGLRVGSIERLTFIKDGRKNLTNYTVDCEFDTRELSERGFIRSLNPEWDYFTVECVYETKPDCEPQTPYGSKCQFHFTSFYSIFYEDTQFIVQEPTGVTEPPLIRPIPFSDDRGYYQWESLNSSTAWRPSFRIRGETNNETRELPLAEFNDSYEFNWPIVYLGQGVMEYRSAATLGSNGPSIATPNLWYFAPNVRTVLRAWNNTYPGVDRPDISEGAVYKEIHIARIS